MKHQWLKLDLRRRWNWAVGVTALMVALFSSAGAAAAAGSPHWRIQALSRPTYFSSSDTALCLEKEACDSYTLLITNNGASPSGEGVEIKDLLPAGLKVRKADLRRHSGEGAESPCSGGLQLTCVVEGPVLPGETLQVTIEAITEPNAASTLANAVTVSGGGTPVAAVNQITSVSAAEPAFQFVDFDFEVNGFDGNVDTKAADHPYSITTSFDLSTSIAADSALLQSFEVREHPYGYSEAIKNVVVELPLGLVGNPEAAPTCPEHLLASGSEGQSGCPADTRIGYATLDLGQIHFLGSGGSQLSYIYNMKPEHGYPAEFGLTYLGKEVFIYVSVVPTPAGYALRAVVPGIPGVGGPRDASLTFFGNPGRENGGSPVAFFTNPSNCSSGPEMAKIEADTWSKPGRWVSAESLVYPQITGCDVLRFQPTLQVAPVDPQVDEPSGYEVDLKVPASASEEAPVPATPDLDSATVALPAGVSLSAAAADGLGSCTAEGTGGINLTAQDLGADGQPHAEQGHCPAASQIGTVEITTPLLSEPLQGHVFLAEPKCGGTGQPACTSSDATNGTLFGVYLEAEGAGVVIKLPGTVSADPSTGQLTASFRQNPQLPFTELRIRFTGGPRAPLANPQTCGSFSASSDLSPWSAPQTPDATPSSLPFTILGCGSREPFSPSLNAGSTTTAAAGFTKFTASFSRKDGEQDLSQVSVHTPPGLLGILSSVSLCPEPRAAQGTCAPSSQIGSAVAAAGSGSHPFWIPEPGQPPAPVYLTGPYRGAPFGLSIVVPAIAGPFNLGDVIVRASINVDPVTAELTITSDPLPQIIDGVPLRLQTVNVTVDRANFMFNPTNCTEQAITATMGSAQGTVATASSPFAATGCSKLPFSPKFTASSRAKTSKTGGASLDVKVGYTSGQANLRVVAVSLPKQLPSRLTTIHKACPAEVFDVNPAACDPGSVVGTAKARTPVLPVELVGPAYLVSHAAAAFPDLVVILQGDGVRLDLTGSIHISAAGITSSRFATVPDAPISSFELSLPEGSHSALTAPTSLCAKSLIMPTILTAQNGAVIKQSTKIQVSGCPKKKSPQPKKKASRASQPRHVGVAAGAYRRL